MTPASFVWRAFFVAAALLLVSGNSSQAQTSKRYRPSPSYIQLSNPDQEEGRKILEQFRSLGLAGDYYMEFDLRFLPRRGKERLRTGQMWGSSRNGTNLTRLAVKDADGAEIRYLIIGGSQPAAWRWKTGEQAPVMLEGKALFEPISDTLLSPFDLQMPFLQWKDFVYEGLAKLRGRPAHRFILYPPAGPVLKYPDLSGVRVSLDTQYGALVETEMLDLQGKAARTLSLMELKKVAEEWIIKSLDLRDESTRSKTRLSFIAAALRLEFSSSLFEPASLADPIQAPASGLVRF